jgi:hypothetical protein
MEEGTRAQLSIGSVMPLYMLVLTFLVDVVS